MHGEEGAQQIQIGRAGRLHARTRVRVRRPAQPGGPIRILMPHSRQPIGNLWVIRPTVA
ncbi:hypothetical protein SCMC78_09230 [Streptomyces sp. CMC78]|uniref:Uncharacterized protein n=1 Tax=Streptomyces sp. CMC78 TaxID=3231512 RepID=A0AB33KAU8_9ACTN